MGLAQIGEFSFVLATVGSSLGIIGPEISGVILASALISILIAPFFFSAANHVYQAANRYPAMARLLNQPTAEDLQEKNTVTDHSLPQEREKVIILGAGRVGRYVSDALRSKKVPHVVVDYDLNVASRLRENGARVVYGDVTSETVLEKAKPGNADLAVVALPEAATTEMAVRLLKKMAPGLRVVARVHRGNDIPIIRKAGADAVIHAEFEAGTEMIRQGLDRLGFADTEVDAYINEVRLHRYREEIV
jgi:CPA2 family monovalent cation:H+ antiporter-2